MKKRARDAKTGRFTTAAKAKRKPDSHVMESIEQKPLGPSVRKRKRQRGVK